MYKTKIDLSEKTRRNVILILNDRLADAIDLQSQVKQAHWNVKGPNFIALHELFDKISELVLDQVDEIAERVTSLGGTAESVSNVKSRLYRGFRTVDGLTVTLFEHDMSADGSQLFRNSMDEPEEVNGLPARLIVMQASSGKAISINGTAAPE